MYSPKAVGTYREGTRGIMGKVVTSAEMSSDGTVIALGTTTTAYLFLRCPGTSVADAFAAVCHSWNHPSTGQVESFAWYPDGESTLVIPEGENRTHGMDDTRVRCVENESNVLGTARPPSQVGLSQQSRRRNVSRCSVS